MEQVTLVIDPSRERTGLSTYGAALFGELRKRMVVKKRHAHAYVPRLLSDSVAAVTGINLYATFQSMPWYVRLPKNSLSHLTSQQQAICLNYLRRKTIVTVHDIIPLVTNTFNSAAARKWYLLAMQGVKNARLLIADSQHTKDDVVRFLGYPEEKIDVVQLGVDNTIFKPLLNEKGAQTILYVGSEMLRKNVQLLFDAFMIVKEEFPHAKLVKVGLPQWRGARQKLLRFVKENHLEDSVIFKDYVSDLAAEYRRATVFVFPSRYEGFGLPPLEAMACGCPVICSKATSLPEVTGDAAMLFDVDNRYELAEKMMMMLKSKNLQKKYSKKGIERAKNFTWEKCAQETQRVYEKVRCL